MAFKNTACICLMEMSGPFLGNMKEDEYAILKNMVSSADTILWVTKGCGEQAHRPEFGLITGFGRTMRSENWSLKFVELSLEPETVGPHAVSQILKVYHKTLAKSSSDEHHESEYTKRSGHLCIPRAVETPQLNEFVAQKTTAQVPKMLPFGDTKDRHLELSIASPGLLDTLYFRNDTLSDSALAPDDVEIKVHATS